jgi:ABC-2 type transport system ATP-binding protein
MDSERWLTALDAALRRRGIAADVVGNVVAEAAAHLRDSGESPVTVFGPPERYATAIGASLAEAEPPAPATAARPPGPVRLAATGITKRYRRRTVLSDVGLTVRAGQIAAVVGANGCGKSTLLAICAGLVAPDAGTVTVAGRLGYCPQDGGTVDFLYPDEHFVLIGAGRGMSRATSRDRGRAAAANLGWEVADAPTARHLSGGTRQKLNLVLSTLSEPDVLLLDEPYQGFDRGTYVNFWDQLYRLRAEGKAIVVVTHLLNQLDGVDLVLDLTTAGVTA